MSRLLIWLYFLLVTWDYGWAGKKFEKQIFLINDVLTCWIFLLLINWFKKSIHFLESLSLIQILIDLTFIGLFSLAEWLKILTFVLQLKKQRISIFRNINFSYRDQCGLQRNSKGARSIKIYVHCFIPLTPYISLWDHENLSQHICVNKDGKNCSVIQVVNHPWCRVDNDVVASWISSLFGNFIY